MNSESKTSACTEFFLWALSPPIRQPVQVNHVTVAKHTGLAIFKQAVIVLRGYGDFMRR